MNKTHKKIIPKSFKLGGTTINVREVDHVDPDSSKLGTMDMNKSLITLYNQYRGLPVSNDAKESTFCHELVHSILGVMGNRELNDNEEFVETFGNFLHQFLKTAE